MARYTAQGGAALEERIDRDLARCVSEIRRALGPVPCRGVVIGGGLGRGEGGLRRGPDGELPYNDYDLFVVVPALPRVALSLVRRRLEALAARLHDELRVEVEIAALPEADLPASPPTLMATDLRAGHRVLHGPADLLSSMPPLPPEALHPVEASRLLLNRAALLLLARGVLRAGPLDAAGAERVARYVRKATLARGDAWLILRGRYVTGTFRCVERLAAEAPAPLAEAYAAAVDERLSGVERHDEATLRTAHAHEARALTDAFGEAEAARLGGPWPPFDARTPYGPAVLAAAGRPGARERLRIARLAGPVAALPPSTAWARCAATLPAVLDGRPTGVSAVRTLWTLHDGPLEAPWLALWRASA